MNELGPPRGIEGTFTFLRSDGACCAFRLMIMWRIGVSRLLVSPQVTDAWYKSEKDGCDSRSVVGCCVVKQTAVDRRPEAPKEE